MKRVSRAPLTRFSCSFLSPLSACHVGSARKFLLVFWPNWYVACCQALERTVRHHLSGLPSAGGSEETGAMLEAGPELRRLCSERGAEQRLQGVWHHDAWPAGAVSSGSCPRPWVACTCPVPMGTRSGWPRRGLRLVFLVPWEDVRSNSRVQISACGMLCVVLGWWRPSLGRADVLLTVESRVVHRPGCGVGWGCSVYLSPLVGSCSALTACAPHPPPGRGLMLRSAARHPALRVGGGRR